MNDLSQRVTVALISALAGGVLTYSTKVLTVEGRLDAMEKSLVRIEMRLYPVPKEEK